MMKKRLLTLAFLPIILFGYYGIGKASQQDLARQMELARQAEQEKLEKQEAERQQREAAETAKVKKEQVDIEKQIQDLEEKARNLDKMTEGERKKFDEDVKVLQELSKQPGKIAGAQAQRLSRVGESAAKQAATKAQEAAEAAVQAGKESFKRVGQGLTQEAETFRKQNQPLILKVKDLNDEIEALKKTANSEDPSVTPKAKADARRKIADNEKKIDDMVKHLGTSQRMAVLGAAGRTQDVMAAFVSAAEKNPTVQMVRRQVQGFVSRRRGVIGVGLLLLALLGIGGGVGLEEGTKEKEGTEVIVGPNGKPPIDDGKDIEVPEDEVIVPPNPYEDPKPDNEAFKQNLLIVANAFNKVESRFKESVERGDYYNAKFRIVLGQVPLSQGQQEVAIEYNFGQGGAGDVGSPLMPIEVNVYPKEIDGFAVKIDSLLAQIKPDYTEMSKILIRPNSAFLFLLKVMLLNKSVLKDPEFKDNSKRVREILTQTALLYSRLVQTADYANPSTQFLLSSIPTAIQNYIGELTTKIYPELVLAAQSNYQDTSAVSEAVLSIRSSDTTFVERVNAMNDTLMPLIQEGLSYADQKLATHAVLRQIADLESKLPTSQDASKKELAQRLNALIPLVADAVGSMQEAGFGKDDVKAISGALQILRDMKAGKAVQNITKPRLGGLKSIVKDIPLSSALDIYYRQFQVLQGTKFSGDYGFIPNDLLLGESETIDAMLAALIRGVKMVTEAEATLLKSKDVLIELRKPGAGTFSINPNEELGKFIKAPSEALTKAQKAVADAVVVLRSDPKNPDNKKAYDDARAKFDDAVKAMTDSLQKFRNAYPPYFPLKLSDGTEKTTLEFVKDALKVVNKVGHPEVLKSDTFKDIYSSFTKTLGLPAASVYDAPISANF